MRKLKTPKTLLVEYDSGEIVGQAYEGEKIRIVNEKNDLKRQKFLKEYDPDFNKGESFVKLYDEILDVLRNNLKPTEFVFAISLAKYISYNDCILRNGAHGNGKFLTMEDLSEHMKIEYSVVRRHMSTLISKGVILKYETGCVENPKLKVKGYICNPWIYMRGVAMNRTIIGMFEKSGWQKLLGM